MKAYVHAMLSAKRYGGKPEEYLHVHAFLDHSKEHLPDMRHRLLLHNSWGVHLAERALGTHLTNSLGKLVLVRTLAEQHVIEDLGRIPTLVECMQDLPMYNWLGGPARPENPVITLVD